MKKLVILSLIAPVVLGVAACGEVANNSTEVVLNADDGNMIVADDNMMDANEMAPANAM